MWVVFLFLVFYRVPAAALGRAAAQRAARMRFPGSDAQCAKGIPSLPWWGTAEMPVYIPLFMPLPWH